MPFDLKDALPPFISLCADYPDQSVYPPAQFRVEWGPIFFRGRLDGAARVLIIGQDPAAHEAIVRRILVGAAGQRLQGFLAKLGVTDGYVMINAFLYSVYNQTGAASHQNDPGIVAYRERWLDALLLGNSKIEVVVALGTIADHAFTSWRAKHPQRAVAYQHILHPTYPESSSGDDPAKLAEATKRLLADWNEALAKLAPVLSQPGVALPLVPYGETWGPSDLATIPECDLPPGLPAWMRSVDPWAVRGPAPSDEKRASITITVPENARLWRAAPSPSPTPVTPPSDAEVRRPDRKKANPLRSAPGRFVLAGCVVTPAQAMEDGFVVINGETIEAVGHGAPPTDAPLIKTSGVILPGLIDLHGHLEYNVFAPWEPPKLFQNRGQWRDSEQYATLVKQPLKMLEQAKHRDDLPRYAEIRALVGGVTAVQGSPRDYSSAETLLRSVDKAIFDKPAAKPLIDLSSETPDGVAKIRAGLQSGKLRTLFVHLAEGVDERSRKELDKLDAAGLLLPQTVIIHGTAFEEAELQRIKAAGAKLVWSPQSNLRLYAKTTPIARALALGIPVALGADWLPTGSSSLLAEIKVARQALRAQGTELPAKRWVQMVTQDAARIAGLEDCIGALAAQRPADLVVLERRRPDPWESIVDADPSWIEMVLINGDPIYARPDWMKTLITAEEFAAAEPLVAWGKAMVLDISVTVGPPQGPPRRLLDIRNELIEHYPQIGPIFA